jgi:hypothetical protein
MMCTPGFPPLLPDMAMVIGSAAVQYSVKAFCAGTWSAPLIPCVASEKSPTDPNDIGVALI